MYQNFINKMNEIAVFKPQELAPMRSAMIRHTKEKNIGKTLIMAVGKAYADKGIKVDQTDINYMIPSLVSAIKKFCPNIRIDEIPEAINNGIFGEYGEYFGLNVTTFTNFVKAYYASEKRRQLAIAALPAPEAKPCPTREELLRAEKKMIVDAFASYCLHGYYLDIANHVYNKLNGRELIQFTAERKKEFYEQARIELLQDGQSNLRGSIGDRSKMKLIVSGLVSNEGDAVNIITRRAKQIALNAYFNELKEMEIDIAEQL